MKSVYRSLALAAQKSPALHRIFVWLWRCAGSPKSLGHGFDAETSVLRLNKPRPGRRMTHFLRRLWGPRESVFQTVDRPPGPHVFYNLSTSHQWRTHPVGIVRVERELGSRLLRTHEDAVHFVYWDRAGRCFKVFSRVDAATILSAEWCDPTSGIALRENKRIDMRRLIRSGDFFVSLGLDWELSPVHEIGLMSQATGALPILACHDTIPVHFPELCTQPSARQFFLRHFIDIAHIAHKLWANSHASAASLLKIWEDAELTHTAPAVQVVPLATWPAVDNLPALSSIDEDRLRHLRAQGNIILYVSHFEARKNHRLLLELWKELYRRQGTECPQLVFVGRHGWGVDTLIEQMRRSNAYLSGKVYWFQDVNDVFLRHLYKECLFTVFPSFAEGWGLAANEAMAVGKVCVVSNCPALIEATQGVMPSYHPLDFPGWLQEIETLLNDSDYRNTLEETIFTVYKQRTWDDFSTDFITTLLTR